jgi:[ribosomal protein S18]-alanine N-acetyltransferase
VRLTLRPYRPEDFETLYAIDQACYDPAVAYSKSELAQYMRLPGADCLVAESGDAPLGFVLSSHESDCGHIITIDVLPPHRRTGVGSALLSAAEKRLAACGITRVALETASNNQPAISFWQKHEYRTRGVLKNYYPNGLDAFAMSKSLRSSVHGDKES